MAASPAIRTSGSDKHENYSNSQRRSARVEGTRNMKKKGDEKMDLKFPELRGGPVQGLNDAGVENFQGAIDVFLSRECGQNTGDAPREGVETVRLEFDRLIVPAKDIPAFSRLRETLQSCLERWRGKEKEREFLEQAIALAEKPEIPVLKISDFGTTGLTGDDTDERGRWLALVKSQGLSNKGDTAGGSFGIGKSSPFAASRFRTVFYGTCTEAGSEALQGVSRLVTHKDAAGKLTQGVGFIGKYDSNGGEDGEPVFRAIRSSADIPPLYRRTEPGTDIWVIGYRSGDEWRNDLVRSILTNFWPAIFHGTIEFRVGTQKITKGNLAELINSHVGQEDFEAHYFYKAIHRQPITRRLRHVGDCALYLAADAPDLPKRICMVRKSGMRIFDYQPKSCRVPFSGLFICSDSEGNKLLRKMEPPKHDLWDPKRVEGPEGKKAMQEIKEWIRDEVKKLNPLFSGNSFNENELAKYVPDDEPDNLPNDDSGRSEEESLEPKPRPGSPDVKPITAKPVAPAIVAAGEDKAGDRDKRGGGSDGGGGGEGDRERKTTVAKPPRVFVRSYRSGPNEYQLLLRSPIRFSGAISVLAIGEDGEQEPVAVNDAKLGSANGRRLILKKGAIHGIQLKPAEPLRVVVRLDTSERRSLTAVAQP